MALKTDGKAIFDRIITGIKNIVDKVVGLAEKGFDLVHKAVDAVIAQFSDIRKLALTVLGIVLVADIVMNGAVGAFKFLGTFIKDNGWQLVALCAIAAYLYIERAPKTPVK